MGSRYATVGDAPAQVLSLPAEPDVARTTRAAWAHDLRKPPRRDATRAADVTDGAVRLVLAGGPLLEVDGVVVAPRGPTRQRATLLLGYLLLAQRQRLTADELAEAAWPEGPPASWTASLRKLMSDVRSWLAQVDLGDAITVAHQTYRVDLPEWATLDVEEAALAMVPRTGTRVDTDQAARAAELLDAELLPGLDAPWLRIRRVQAQELRIAALEALADGLRLEGRFEASIAAARQVIAIDGLRESAYRLVMAAHRDAGRVGSALRVYEECRNHLIEELGTPPSASTVAAYQALLLPFASEQEGYATVAAPSSPPTSTFADMALAMEAVGSRTALGNLEGRLAAIEGDPHPDPLARVEALIALGQARWALSGATDQLRRISLAAGEAALSLGSASHFGAVAALASTTTGVGEHDADTEDLCARAAIAFADDPAAQARILSLQAEQCTGIESVRRSEAAVAIARTQRDPGLLLDTLLVLDQSVAWTADLPARLAIEAECSALLEHSSRWRTRPTFEPLTRLQDGQIDWFRAEAERLAVVASTSSQWEPRFYATAFGAVLAHLAGDLTRGFLLADQLMAESREEINAVHASAALYLALTRDSGGVANLLPIVVDMAAKNPRISSFQAALALGHSVVGDHAEAARVLDLLIDELDDLPRDHIWTLTLGLLAEAVSVDGTKDHATRLLAELDPYAGQLCAGAHATVVLGSMDWCRGVLAATAEDHDLAVEHLTAALELERRIAAPLLQARTSAWLAVVLHRRGIPDDRQAVATLAADAVRLAVPAGTAIAVHRVLDAAGLVQP
jgi:DNA-binding SARP family transcriptional activator/tetratricopeptide (TPR) repeat protein